MSRQFKNGTCSCWNRVDKRLAAEGNRMARAFGFDGHEWLELATERTDGNRKRSRRIVCSYCPFCGKKLKDRKQPKDTP